jgi:hypothetical protein
MAAWGFSFSSLWVPVCLAATRRVLEQTGEFWVFALSKGRVDLDTYRQSETYDYCVRQQGIVDRIWVVFPVNEDSESCFCFDRLGKTKER